MQSTKFIIDTIKSQHIKLNNFLSTKFIKKIRNKKHNKSKNFILNFHRIHSTERKKIIYTSPKHNGKDLLSKQKAANWRKDSSSYRI